MVNSFRKRAAIRIAIVSVALAALSSPISWYVSLENAKKSTVSLAMDETRRMMRHHDALNLSGPNAVQNAIAAARSISDGLFDVVEIYDQYGAERAQSFTEKGVSIHAMMPAHGTPAYKKPSYENLDLQGNDWALRVFVPLHESDSTGEPSEDSLITGYFEGVRVIPDWQKEEMIGNALAITLMVIVASLLCGMAVYPVVVHLSRDNERKAVTILNSNISMMEALGRAIAKRDSDTGTHNYRVAWTAASIAEKMGIKDDRMQSLIAGSFLHDVGKIGIPDSILLKPGILDDSESSTMRTHVLQGEDIVTGTGWLDSARAVISCHHEKWDGSGYPHGLSGESIPLEARIFAVADVFDALCSERPYKDPMDFDTVIEVLKKDSGTHFDPAVLEIFLPMARNIFDQLAICTDAEVRQLLEKRVRHHFHV